MAEDPDRVGAWATISELARLKGLDKAGVSRRVAKLEAAGLLVTRKGARSTKMVNVAAFDRAVGETTDAVRALNGSGASLAALPSNDPILSKEQARRAGYDADLKQLDLEERLGRVVHVDAVRKAMERCAQNMIRAIEQFSNRAEECAAAVAKEGVIGARAFLKTLARQARDELARSMTLGAPGDDDAPAKLEEADAWEEAEAAP